MNFLNRDEIQERISVLNYWLNRHHKDHFHFHVVSMERDYYENLAGQMDDIGINYADANPVTQCYEQIQREEI